MKTKIKDGEEFKLFGKKLISRKSCPKNKIFIVNDNYFVGGLVFDKKAPPRVEFPNFQWETDNCKKVTKFRYFMAGIKLWFMLLKDKFKK